ncbi:MAG: hypothetical protein MZV64_33850 [Ignavibacteriales bacterium]|nr:hypothetical protein [Ignavibacteriales bacterium]
MSLRLGPGDGLPGLPQQHGAVLPAEQPGGQGEPLPGRPLPVAQDRAPLRQGRGHGRLAPLQPGRDPAAEREPGQPVPHHPLLQPRQLDLPLRRQRASRRPRAAAAEPGRRLLRATSRNWDYSEVTITTRRAGTAGPTATIPARTPITTRASTSEAVAGAQLPRLQHRPGGQARPAT